MVTFSMHPFHCIETWWRLTSLRQFNHLMYSSSTPENNLKGILWKASSNLSFLEFEACITRLWRYHPIIPHGAMFYCFVDSVYNISGLYRLLHGYTVTPYYYVCVRHHPYSLFPLCNLFKGQMTWISEKQRLPVKTSATASFYGELLHRVRFYDRRERNYVIYVHIDVNLDGRGWACCCSTFNSQKRKWWRSCLKSRPPAL